MVLVFLLLMPFQKVSDLEIYQNGKSMRNHYERGKPLDPLHVIGKTKNGEPCSLYS